MGYKIEVTYKNQQMQTVSTKQYDLDDYTMTLRNDIVKLISDVEDIIYRSNGGKSKCDWDEDIVVAFNRLRHKILDKAGEIGRIPSAIVSDEDAPCESEDTEEEQEDSTGLSYFIDHVFRGRKNC